MFAVPQGKLKGPKVIGSKSYSYCKHWLHAIKALTDMAIEIVHVEFVCQKTQDYIILQWTLIMKITISFAFNVTFWKSFWIHLNSVTETFAPSECKLSSEKTQWK